MEAFNTIPDVGIGGGKVEVHRRHCAGSTAYLLQRNAHSIVKLGQAQRATTQLADVDIATGFVGVVQAAGSKDCRKTSTPVHPLGCV